MVLRSVLRTALVVSLLVACGATAAGARSVRDVIYKQSGDRSGTTEAFRVPAQWTLSWSFDCRESVFGEGSFVVAVHDVSGGRVADTSEGAKIDEFGTGGSGRQGYDTAGRKTLVVVAQCPWKVKVRRA